MVGGSNGEELHLITFVHLHVSYYVHMRVFVRFLFAAQVKVCKASSAWLPGWAVHDALIPSPSVGLRVGSGGQSGEGMVGSVHKKSP